MDGSAGAVPAKRRALLARLLLVIAGLLAGLLAVEAVLRIGSSVYRLTPVVQSGRSGNATIRDQYVDDANFVWVAKDYRDRLRDARRTRPQVVFLGDSCTELGTYPARTLERLAAIHAPVTTGLVVAGAGWSSEQGLVQLQRDVLPLHPRVVVVYFGWNDHWMALGLTDPELRRAQPLLWLSERLRLVRLLMKVRMGIRARNPARPNRVPPDRYLENLKTMSALASSTGAVPILVTAPSNHVAGHEPAQLQDRHLQRLSDLVPVHRQYVELTRQAARDSGAFLCDAAREFDELTEDRAALFMNDGIHFTPRGDAILARIVSDCIARAVQR